MSATTKTAQLGRAVRTQRFTPWPERSARRPERPATSTATPALSRAWARPGASIGAWARSYFASDARRALVSALGLLWVLDGALQLQPYMYSGGFITQLKQGALSEPRWLEASIGWSAHLFAQNATLWNTLFALIQLSIGIGLLYRPTVKPALALSFAWALVVWWFGEAFGFMLMQMTAASPLLGAPGAALLYGLAGAALWPTERPGGLLGLRGTRAAWATLWLAMAWLWLQFQNSGPNAIAAQIKVEAPAGASWLSGVEHWAASATTGNGVWLALLLASLSAAIGVSVAANWHPRPFLLVAVALNLIYWAVGEGFGGIFTGHATDPNTGPLFILFAAVLYTLGRSEKTSRATSNA